MTKSPKLNLRDYEIIDTAIRTLQKSVKPIMAESYEETRQKIIQLREKMEIEYQ
jgi:hypothetical protein